jgi:dolichyl-phosphate-mannose-protein mannosyltransferase
MALVPRTEAPPSGRGGVVWAGSSGAAGRLTAGVCVASALGALLVYLRTLAPSIPTGDSGELIVVSRVLGVAHPPGYPLFSLLGHLFSLLPFGSVAYRVNLLSAVLGAASVGVLTLLTPLLLSRREQRRSLVSIAAAVTGLSLAFSLAFWSYAVVAEVFTLNSLFGGLIILVLVKWQRAPQRTGWLYLFGFAAGLAATNQQTIVLLAPACIVLLGSGASRLISAGTPVPVLARHAAIALGLLVVGLLPYLYLPLAAGADPPLNWGDPRTPQALWRHLTRADYGTFALVVSEQGAVGSAVDHIVLLFRNLWDGYTPAGCLLAIAGAVWLFRRERTIGVALGLAFVCTGPLFVAYARPVIDSPVLYGVIERFYILPSTFFAVFVGLGAAQVLLWIPTFVRRRIALIGAGALLLALPIASLVLHHAQADQSGNEVDHYFGHDALAPLEQNALFILTGDAATMSVDYAQLVDGDRPDVAVLNLEKLKLSTYVQQMRRQHPGITIPFEAYSPGGDQIARLVEANAASRPVYLLEPPKDPGFADRFDAERAGFAMKLVPKGSGTDPYAFTEQHLDVLRAMHYPAQRHPETTFESLIDQAYASVAFDVGYVLDDGVRDSDAITFYRIASRLDPTNAPALKNLGLLLYKQGAPASDVGALWRQYLLLTPTDPQAPAIRQRLSDMNQE